MIHLQPNRFKIAEYERTVYVATAEKGHTKEDILSPDYWAHAANKLKPYDRIEVRHDEGEYFCELLVTQVGRGWAKVVELSYKELSKSEALPTIPEPYEVVWKGPHRKWAVIRKADGEYISEGHDDRNKAHNWLVEHLKVAA